MWVCYEEECVAKKKKSLTHRGELLFFFFVFVFFCLQTTFIYTSKEQYMERDARIIYSFWRLWTLKWSKWANPVRFSRFKGGICCCGNNNNKNACQEVLLITVLVRVMLEWVYSFPSSRPSAFPLCPHLAAVLLLCQYQPHMFSLVPGACAVRL